MTTASFTVPVPIQTIYYAKKSRDGFFGIILNLLVFGALVGLVWWFYQAMKNNPPTPKKNEAPVPIQAAITAEPELPPPPPPSNEPTGAEPSDVGAEVDDSS